MPPLPARRRRVASISHGRDREFTRAAILTAAEEEFARHGLEGARTEEIAHRSGVTKGMIYHYFESKEKLYEAALEQLLAPLLISLQQFASPEADPLEAFKGVLRRILELAGERPGVPAMLFLEVIQNRGAYYQKVGFPSLYHVLATILDNGQQRGVFRPLDSRHTAINIVGTCGFYYCAATRLQPIWLGATKPLSPKMKKRHADEAFNLIMQGICAKPDAAAKQ
jgi:TetR/AcrR family transcriptional regulator